jgi:hypothetical protein
MMDLTMGKAWIAILTTVLAVAVAALAMAPTPALAKSGAKPTKSRTKPKKSDIAATKAYIQADYALVHTARTNMLAGEAALEELRSKIGAECPLAATASPENEAAEKLSNEVVGTMGVVFVRDDVQAVNDFAEAVEHLRWSNQKLTRKVSVYAAKLKALAALEMPNVCGDVSSWAGSGYRALPASTTQFDQRFSSEDVGIGEVPAHLLARYEDRGERTLLGRTRQFENELVDAEARAVEPWSKILDELDLQP